MDSHTPVGGPRCCSRVWALSSTVLCGLAPEHMHLDIQFCISPGFLKLIWTLGRFEYRSFCLFGLFSFYLSSRLSVFLRSWCECLKCSDLCFWFNPDTPCNVEESVYACKESCVGFIVIFRYLVTVNLSMFSHHEDTRFGRRSSKMCCVQIKTNEEFVY